MQLFKLKTRLSKFDHFADFAREFKLSEHDLVITNEFLYDPFMKSLNLPCHFIMQEKFGLGEPSDKMMNTILKEVKGVGFDRVIAVGGGTVIDISKLFVLKGVEDVTEAFERKIPIVKEKQLVILPTTCGTGSEVTNISIAEITSKHTKMGLADDAIVADDAVLVPELLKGLPFKFYACSAIDALVHATESYVSPKSNPYTRLYCRAAIEIIIDVFQGIAAEKARLVIAEMNENMPYVEGDNKIHISRLDYIIPTNLALSEIPLPKITDVEKAIGRNCASLIEDGSTLQLGIGAIPDAVLLFMGDKKDLGIHTEMFSDGVIDLVESGVVNGSKKTLHPGKLVATFLMGTRRLYDFVDKNACVEMRPVDYVNDPRVIAQNEKMVSINSCIEIDLMGQVASETIGLKQFSGTGGQVDYVRGAAWSAGGKSIMAMPSTAAKGKASRIVPFLAQGAAVTTSRNDVDYVVTEYGIARLKGKTLKQRARALIAVAHPDFRPMLEEEYQKRFKD